MPPLSSFSKSCIALAVAQSLSLHNAHAATIEVTSNQDDGTDCTLREALATTNTGTDQVNGCDIDISESALGSNDTITFGTGIAGQTIGLVNGELVIARSVSINPDGATTTIDANQNSRVIHISAGTVTLNGLVITGGIFEIGGGILIGDAVFDDDLRNNSTVSGNSAQISGRGIDTHGLLSPSLSLSNSTVSGNLAGDGGGIFVYKANVSLNNSLVSSNTAGNGGGGIFITQANASLNNSMVSGNSAADAGGGIISAFSSSVSLSNSTVSGNSTAEVGGGIISAFSSSVSLYSSRVSGNSAHDQGGGFFVFEANVNLSNSLVSSNTAGNGGGGAYAVYSSNLSLNNSTVSSNTAIIGGGLWIFQQSSLNLSNSTLSTNSADYGASIAVEQTASASLSNSIVANSVVMDECYIGSGSTITAGFDSIIDDNSCGAATIKDPRLAPLADNGGPTLSHALLPDSPAIDNATAAGATAFDQRGLAAIGVRDSGAFELQNLSFSLSPEIVAENAGVSTGTVTRSVLVDRELSVNLSSSDPSLATVPINVTIPANALSATFAINAVDDLIADGDGMSTIKVSSIGYTEGSASITVTDDDDDDDGDNVADKLDNCPTVANSDQADFEGDGLGDMCDSDIDGDGMPNWYEERNGLNPRNSFDRDADADGDGFTNLEEFQFRTDPQMPDRDDNGNGIPDAIENKPITLTPILLLLLDD